MYVYIVVNPTVDLAISEHPDYHQVYAVGFYMPWSTTETPDFYEVTRTSSEEEAAARVSYLNGGMLPEYFANQQSVIDQLGDVFSEILGGRPGNGRRRKKQDAAPP